MGKGLFNMINKINKKVEFDFSRELCDKIQIDVPDRNIDTPI